MTFFTENINNPKNCIEMNKIQSNLEEKKKRAELDVSTLPDFKLYTKLHQSKHMSGTAGTQMNGIKWRAQKCLLTYSQLIYHK